MLQNLLGQAFQQQASQEPDTLIAELSRYSELRQQDPVIDPLQWWKAQQNWFPRLAHLARIVLAVPPQRVRRPKDYFLQPANYSLRRGCEWNRILQINCFLSEKITKQTLQRKLTNLTLKAKKTNSPHVQSVVFVRNRKIFFIRDTVTVQLDVVNSYISYLSIFFISYFNLLPLSIPLA